MKNFRKPIDAKACTFKHTEVTSKIPKAETVRYTQRTCEWKSKSKKQTNTHTKKNQIIIIPRTLKIYRVHFVLTYLLQGMWPVLNGLYVQFLLSRNLIFNL